MGPIEGHILLHHLHHKDLVEEQSLHLHLLLQLHKGLAEEHIQAQASGSGGNCVNHVDHLKGQILRQIYSDFERKYARGSGKLKQVFSGGIHEVFLCAHQHQRIIPLPQGLLGPSVILYTTLPARLASTANIAEPTAIKCLQK